MQLSGINKIQVYLYFRYDRGGMVQTAEQYEFIHKALYLFEQTLDSKPSTSSD